MNSVSADFKDMLVADSSLNFTFAKNLFIGRVPPSPKECVVLLDTYGAPPYLGLCEVGYEYPAIQIKVRSINYQSGYTLIESIKDSLHGRNHEIWNGTLYTVIACSSGPTLLEWDDIGLVYFFINFNLQRRVA